MPPDVANVAWLIALSTPLSMAGRAAFKGGKLGIDKEEAVLSPKVIGCTIVAMVVAVLFAFLRLEAVARPPITVGMIVALVCIGLTPKWAYRSGENDRQRLKQRTDTESR